MHFIALFQSVIWPLKVADKPALIASLGISNESCPLQDLDSRLGGHEQACTKEEEEEEDNVTHGRGRTMPASSILTGFWVAIVEPSWTHRGAIEEPPRTNPKMEVRFPDPLFGK